MISSGSKLILLWSYFLLKILIQGVRFTPKQADVLLSRNIRASRLNALSNNCCFHAFAGDTSVLSEIKVFRRISRRNGDHQSIYTLL